jgi:homocysteine S-methyltransferase
MVYPNSGEEWDAERHAWTGRTGFEPAQVRRWVSAGAAAVGGCCRVGPIDIAAIARELDARALGVAAEARGNYPNS